jgi:hypothetical protein
MDCASLMPVEKLELSPPSVSLKFLTASRVAGNAPPGEKQPLANSVKRGGACLCAHDLSSFRASRPDHPQGHWLAETLPGGMAGKI